MKYFRSAGDLKHRVTFYNPPENGGWSSTGEDWTEDATVWADIQTQKGYRFFNSDATQWQDQKIVSIRYREGIHPGMRIRINGKMHEIESLVNDDERNKWYTIIVKEVN